MAMPAEEELQAIALMVILGILTKQVAFLIIAAGVFGAEMEGRTVKMDPPPQVALVQLMGLPE